MLSTPAYDPASAKAGRLEWDGYAEGPLGHLAIWEACVRKNGKRYQ